MEILTTHKKRNLHTLSKESDTQYITYNLKTKEFNSLKDIEKIDSKFFNKINNYQVKNLVLIYIKEMAIENATNTTQIIEAIKNSSFSVSQRVEDDLVKYIKLKPSINFIDKEDLIVQYIQKLMKSESPAQARKYYNNILLRIKFTRIDLLEKTLEEKEDNFKESIKKRDELRENKKKYADMIEINNQIGWDSR